jgi:hypothetical protein
MAEIFRKKTPEKALSTPGDAVEMPHIWKMENGQQDREMAGENLGCHGLTTGRSAQEE